MRNKKFFDIKQPGHKTATPRVVHFPQHLPALPIFKNIGKLRRRIGGAVITLVSLVLIFSFFGGEVFEFKNDAVSSAPKIYADFKDGASALFGFDLEKAKSSFESANQRVADLHSQAPLSLVPAIISNLFNVSQGAVRVSAILSDLQVNGLSLLLGKQGEKLLSLLQNLSNEIVGLDSTSRELEAQAVDVGYPLGADFKNMSANLGEAGNFLSVFTEWLSSKNKQRLLLFFQNPSEMRPGGGFIGSYGIATIFQGNLLDLSVRDIYDPDGQLDLKVVPPKPLQGITDTWEARDANWFLDFPTSARKVTQFLEASKIYSEQGVTFSGAVALNIAVLEDILRVVGPIVLNEYKITVTSENVLRELQAEVEAGEDKARGEPKKILQILTPAIFEKLSKLDSTQKQELFQKLAKRFTAKDVMIYFKDPIIQNYLQRIGVAGELAELPNNFFGDYLGIVNASVGGGKSDEMIEQTTKFTSVFEIDGRIKNQVTISRSHQGNNENEWWYKATNRAYIQLYTPNGAKLVRTIGATEKVIKPLVTYTGKNFQIDPDLFALEQESSFLGKDIFSTWLDVKAGVSKKIVFEYYNPYRFNFQPGPYQFIFDKQSGYRGGLELTFQAPVGFKWQESNSSTFSASFEDLPRRIVLDLNLLAMQ